MIPELQKQILDANVGRTINQTWNKASDWVHGLPFYNRPALGSRITEAFANAPGVKDYIEWQQSGAEKLQQAYDKNEADGDPISLAVNRFTDVSNAITNTGYAVLGAPLNIISKALNVDPNVAATTLMILGKGKLPKSGGPIQRVKVKVHQPKQQKLLPSGKPVPTNEVGSVLVPSIPGDISKVKPIVKAGVAANLLQANVTPQSFKDITADKELVAWAIDQGFIPADTLPTRKQLALAARYQKQIENMNRAYLRSDKDMFYEKSALAPWNISVYGKKFQNLPPPLQRRILALKAASGEKIHLHHKWQKMKDAESRIYLKKLVERGEASMEDLRLFDFLLDKSGRSAGGIYGANPKRQSLVPLTESSHVGLHGKYKDQGLEAKRNQSTEFKKSLKGKTATQVIEGAIKDRDKATPALNEVMHEMHELEIRGQKLLQFNQ